MATPRKNFTIISGKINLEEPIVGLLDFLGQLPVVDDLVDFWGALLSDPDESEIVARESGQLDGKLSSSVFDYGAFHQEMYWIEVWDTGQNTQEWLLEQPSQVPVENDSLGKTLSGK